MLRRESVWAVVPVKELDSSKSRLGAALGPEEKAALCLRMLEHVLREVGRCRRIGRCAVVSRDPRVLEMAERRGGVGVAESGRGLNKALRQGVSVAELSGAEAVLLLPADLPLSRASELDEMVGLAGKMPCVVIARAARDGGTNALLIAPPRAVEPAFGLKSFEAHCRQARRTGIPVHRFDGPGLAFDLDTPGDLERLGGTAPRPA